MFMRLVVLGAILAVLIGIASRLDVPGLLSQIAQNPGRETDAPPSRGPVVLRADQSGHYFVDASISGRAVRFVVDTGATSVVISAETARRLNLSPSRSDFTGISRTANGAVPFVPIQLAEVRVGSIVLRNVDAAILPEGALETDLLGMSFLKRLRGFQSAGGQMILTQ